MGKHIFEEGPRRGHAAGDTSIEQQASQLASDIKYKARKKMKGTSGSNLSPGQVQALYRSLLNSSPAPGGVKAIVKKKLFGEQVDCGEKLVSETLENTASKVFARVFVEGGGQKVEEIEEEANQKFIVRVTDRATRNTSYRKADRAKIAELRANKNISSVEITGRKEVDDAYGEKHEKKYGPAKGKNTVGDKDGDGTKEPDRHEYAGVKDRAIKKAMAKEETLHEDEYRRMLAKERKAEKERESKRGGVKSITPGKYASSTGKDYANSQMSFHKKVTGKTATTEEVIYEKEENGNKKLDVMKGTNKINTSPTIGEKMNLATADMGDVIKDFQKSDAPQFKGKSKKERQKMAIAAKLTAERGGRRLGEQVVEPEEKKGLSPEEKMQLANKDKMLKKKIMMQRQTMQMQRQGRLPLNYGEEVEEIRYCPKCEKDETRSECSYGTKYWDENSQPAKAEDSRSIPTKINLAKNKLRAMGLKMSYDIEGEEINERTRYAKETGKDPQTGKPSEKGGTLGGDDTRSKVMRHMKTQIRKTGGLMSSRGKPVQPQGKKQEKGAKKYQGQTPVDRIKAKLAQKRAPKPDVGSRFD